MDLNIKFKVSGSYNRKYKYDKHDENTKQKIGQLRTKDLLRYCSNVDTDIYGKTNEFSKELLEQFEPIQEDFVFFMGHWLQGNRVR